MLLYKKKTVLISLCSWFYHCFLLFLFLFTADDGKLLLGLPKVKVLRNDKREGTVRSVYCVRIVTFLNSSQVGELGNWCLKGCGEENTIC